MTATIIAEMKYPSVFHSYICFSADRSNRFQIIFLMYKHFPHESRHEVSSNFGSFKARVLID